MKEDKRNYYEILDGQIVSTLPIAIQTRKLPPEIIEGYEDILVQWVLSLQAVGIEKSKIRFESDLPAIGRIITELIKNGYHIMGVKDGRIKIGLETCPEGYKPIRQYPDPDDFEVIDRLEVSRKGLDALGRLFRSRRLAVEWAGRVIENIRAQMPEDEIPF